MTTICERAWEKGPIAQILIIEKNALKSDYIHIRLYITKNGFKKCVARKWMTFFLQLSFSTNLNKQTLHMMPNRLKV